MTPGTYVLLLRCSQSGTVRIGQLGEIPVQPGYCLYVGSAFGPGGLSGRISHHLRPPVSPHWHIDYLRQAGQVVEIWIASEGRKWEHAWAQVLCEQPECSLPLARFGSSDCRCPAHLVSLPGRRGIGWFEGILENAGYSGISLQRLVILPGEKG